MLLLFSLALIVALRVIGPSQIETWFENPFAWLIETEPTDLWQPPAEITIPNDASGDEIRYGKELIANTAKYLGPQGKVMAISNGMNCQNCHLNAGTKPFGNNYSAVASTYPRFRARSGTVETIEKRVNDCLERSLNGHSLPDSSRELKAMVSYIKWLGVNVPKGEIPKGAGLVELPYLSIPADPAIGKKLYVEKCTDCHGKDGAGVKESEAASWTYPPLWGSDSFNDGAGLFRLSRFAAYIKANMPFGASYDQPKLSDEEAWHLAAYINSLPRPQKKFATDWPDISQKPIDHPYGPYADGFSEQQHKYGPFKPIIEAQK